MNIHIHLYSYSHSYFKGASKIGPILLKKWPPQKLGSENSNISTPRVSNSHLRPSGTGVGWRVAVKFPQPKSGVFSYERSLKGPCRFRRFGRPTVRPGSFSHPKLEGGIIISTLSLHELPEFLLEGRKISQQSTTERLSPSHPFQQNAGDFRRICEKHFIILI